MRIRIGVEPQNPRQHEDRSDHRVEEKLYRRIHFALMTVHADEQRHGNQRGFPEEIKQEEVERDEHANQRRLQHQQ